MSPTNLTKWLNVTKKQLRQVGKLIDSRLTGLINRHLKVPPASTINRRSEHIPARIPIPVPIKVRNGNFLLFNIRSLPLLNSQIIRKPTPFISPIKAYCLDRYNRFINTDKVKTPTVISSYPNYYNSLDYSILRNKILNGRPFFSIASITSTRDAVKWLISSSFNVSPMKKLVNDYKMHQLMKQQAISPDVGCYIEFKLPNTYTYPYTSSSSSTTFLDHDMVSQWEKHLNDQIQIARDIQSSISNIFETYGSLPITSSNKDGVIRIHFPNATVNETENLISTLDIANGIIYKDDENATVSILDDTMSNWTSFADLHTFSPILSDIDLSASAC
ncbi:Spg5p NDAI_0I00730 [Naumovozyma dairenensis CBS 421]|uniref:Uncharacterized protein n=1 Tax=Naumovozyma dairenensis (strain ATCC 10597 / BCRC 20456 / CBS 421 / NBRC 0211 / NRRL Y-12639) TaxID=1071378 RepID=G0WFT1_NAUDC|nr:hypothetical protein NDAI_0I00730 [Naumovozyma dairenensis CBS 421]CCD26642.1 hypothetical protein NDAI_0I00730 [Naumovozyma dairenensis CBS 421]